MTAFRRRLAQLNDGFAQCEIWATGTALVPLFPALAAGPRAHRP